MSGGAAVALDIREAGYGLAPGTRPWSVPLRLAKPWAIVAVLAAAGVVLRVLLVRGLWVDEAISVHQAHMPLGAMLEDLRQTDNHPPLYFLTLWLTVRGLGFSPLAVHTPSIIAGTLLVPAIFVTGRELFGRRTGLIAAALAAFAPLPIWYSQEARMYAFFMLFATLAVWAQVRAVRDGRVRYWAAYAGFTIALVYTHWFSILPIAIQQLAFAVVVFQRVREGRRTRLLVLGICLTWLAVLIAVLPLASYAITQFHHDQVAGTGFAAAPAAETAPSGVSVYALLTNIVWAIWGYHADSTMLRTAALWPILMLIALTMLGRRRSHTATLVFALAIVPMLVLLVVSVKKRDLFEVRYFAGAVPMLLLLGARGLATMSRKLPAILAAGALIASLVAGLVDQQLNGSNPRTYDFRGAIHKIESMARPGDTVLYAPDYLNDVIEYYAPRLRAQPLRGPAPKVPGRGGVFLLASFLDQPGVAGTVGSAEVALRQDRRLVATNHREKIGVWEYRPSELGTTGSTLAQRATGRRAR
jgi:hypothetical protein